MACDIPDEVKIPVSGSVVVCDGKNEHGFVASGRVVIRQSHWAT